MASRSSGSQSSFGPPFSWDKVVADLERALAGPPGDPGPAGRAGPHLRLPATRGDAGTSPRSASTTAASRRHRGRGARPTEPGRAVPDHPRLADLDLDISRAKVQTLGARVVDSFYVRDGGGGQGHRPGHLAEIERRPARWRAPLAARVPVRGPGTRLPPCGLEAG